MYGGIGAGLMWLMDGVECSVFWGGIASIEGTFCEWEIEIEGGYIKGGCAVGCADGGSDGGVGWCGGAVGDTNTRAVGAANTYDTSWASHWRARGIYCGSPSRKLRERPCYHTERRLLTHGSTTLL